MNGDPFFWYNIGILAFFLFGFVGWGLNLMKMLNAAAHARWTATGFRLAFAVLIPIGCIAGYF